MGKIGLRLEILLQIWAIILIRLFREHNVRNNTGETTGVGANVCGLYLEDYINVIKEVTVKYSLPVLDFYTLGKIDMNNIYKYTIDGLHPTSEYGIHLGHTIAEANTLHAL